MQIRNALLAATMLALPLAAHAQPVTGLYISGGAGLNVMQDESVTFATGDKGKVDRDPGGVAVLSLGWGFGNGLRVEAEGDYRYNNARRGNGNEQKWGPMVNVLYDFYSISPFVVPYAGLGAGYQWADLLKPGGDKGAFAYQAILGAAFPIQPVPGLAVTAEYRFLGMAGDRTYDTGLKAHDDYNHAVLVGLRYAFWAPAPAPAPAAQVAPAPPTARSYLVFFDWDKADLTPRAQQIIHEAADNSTKVKYTRIEVNGYTDTSGTPQYNQGLSIRRAQAVAAELVKDGVPKGAIAIQGFGETHLLVPTGAGVREPQNRRVEIIIR
jgi:outer membrane protein OmpA-like peptidoglycan-associated protein